MENNNYHQNTPPPFYPSEKPKSKKGLIIGICIAAIAVVGIAVAVIVSKSPDNDVAFNDGEDERLAIMSEQEWSKAEKYAQQHGHTDDTENWKKTYARNEFGEEDQSRPSLSATLNGYKYLGESDEGDYSTLFITLDPQYGIELFEDGTLGSGFEGDDRMLIRQNGEVTDIECVVSDGRIYLNTPDVIQQFVDFMQAGNFELAIAGEGYLTSRRWNYKVNDDLKNVRTALRFFRDIPNVERIYGSIQ